jgi:hypothetical protein
MTPDRLKEILDYSASTGVITNKKTKRILQADHDGLVAVFCSKQKKLFKIKLEKIAYILAYGVNPNSEQKVLHKNLDISDNSSKNLTLVTRRVFLLIKEAHRNLTQGIRLSSHPTDQFNYVVYWIEQNQEKQKVVHDIVEARKVMLKLQLKYSKILTKYCVFD